MTEKVIFEAIGQILKEEKTATNKMIRDPGQWSGGKSPFTYFSQPAVHTTKLPGQRSMCQITALAATMLVLPEPFAAFKATFECFSFKAPNTFSCHA